MTGTALTIPTLLFFIFEAKYFTDEYTAFIPILIGILYMISIINLLIASFIDPGMIRRFIITKENMKNIEINKENKRKVHKIFQLGHIMTYKYCYSCGIIRPNRSTHCRICNNCVERMDHHCPWIGICAGKRNYIFFFIFVMCVNILEILVIIFGIIRIVNQVNDYSDINNYLPENENINHLTAFSLDEVVMSFYLIIYCVFFMYFTTRLFIYHIILILTNSTTKEKLKNAYIMGNPYTRNVCQNIKNILCPRVKKHDILEILRGDFKEICDLDRYNGTNNNFSIKDLNLDNKDDINNNYNESIAKFNIKTITTENLSDFEINKNIEPKIYEINSKKINNPQEKDNEKNSFNNLLSNNTNKNNQYNIKEPEPQDTITIKTDKETNFLENQNPQIKEFVKNFQKNYKYNSE